MTITPETIAELRGLMAYATQRPWMVDDEGDDVAVIVDEGDDFSFIQVTADLHQGDDGLTDARLIAAAVNALPALLDAAEQLAEVTAERDALAASVARVRELHVMHPDDCKCLERMFGGECFHHGGCEACRCKFPCSTLAALDGSGS